jgi:hypothetical protein
VVEGPFLLGLQEGRERALHLVEDALRHGLVLDHTLHVQTLERSAGQDPDRNQQCEQDAEQRQTDASHPGNR